MNATMRLSLVSNQWIHYSGLSLVTNRVTNRVDAVAGFSTWCPLKGRCFGVRLVEWINNLIW